MLATALVVLTGPLVVTGFAAGGVSVGDTIDALGGVVSEGDDQVEVATPGPESVGQENRAVAPEGQGGSTASSGPGGTSAQPDDPGRDVGEPPGDSAPPPAAPAPPPAPAEPSAPSAPQQPAAADQPGPVPDPLDGLNDIADDPVGGAEDVLDGVKGLIP